MISTFLLRLKASCQRETEGGRDDDDDASSRSSFTRPACLLLLFTTNAFAAIKEEEEDNNINNNLGMEFDVEKDDDMDLNEEEEEDGTKNDMESYALQLDDFTGEILKPPRQKLRQEPEWMSALASVPANCSKKGGNNRRDEYSKTTKCLYIACLYAYRRIEFS